jgi:hypothetical protein
MRHVALFLGLVELIGPCFAVRPSHAKELTVFHVNQATFGEAPVNMNTGNANGDSYFDVRSVDLPIECAHITPQNAHDCQNAELVSNDLVITKLVLEVDARSFGTYGYCNLCVNGSDHISNISCTNGAYSCICGKNQSLDPPFERCGSNVGTVNISQRVGSKPNNCTSEVDCYLINLARKLDNVIWYSTTASGWCDQQSSNTNNCTWRVDRSIKRVNKTCSDNVLYSAVERNDNSGCFKRCNESSGVIHRNLTDPCWIRCFYSTVLGPNGGTSNASRHDGIDNRVLERAWEAPFKSEDPSRGGCPDLPTPPMG